MHTECKASKEEKGKKCFVRCTRPKEASLTGIGALFAPTPEGRGVTPFSRLFKTSTAQYPKQLFTHILKSKSRVSLLGLRSLLVSVLPDAEI